MYECTRGLEDSVVYHNTNSPGALNIKQVSKLVSTILAASTACQESRPGTTPGRADYPPNVRVDGLPWNDVLSILTSPTGLHLQECWNFSF